ncbi:MAG: DEAD/DEAH box helicase family protein, partial [Anaerolineae bacterium]|nr:DEAD/DEAH box helicase family protein [Anaerolineae bacterium]
RHPENTVNPDIPPDLHATLRPYQERGFGWLAQMAQMRLGACLADDMGLGKTLQTITLWLYERTANGSKKVSPALLVCPTSVVGNWGHEISRFAPSLKVYKHQGTERLRDKDFIKQAKEADVVLTSYALLHRDMDFIKKVKWSSFTLDEAQNIKNPATKQAQAARSIEAQYRLALTGTPVENRLTELWSIFNFLNPGYLGSQPVFKSEFATPIERYRDPDAAAALKKLTAPFILRRVKTDPHVIADLPDKFENKVYCGLTPEQATLYEAVVREEMDSIESAMDDMARRGGVLRMLTRLKQICNHPAHFLKEGESAPMAGRSGKLERMVEMLAEIQEVSERALIFSQYAEMGTLLQTYLRDNLQDEVLFLHGAVPAKKRDEMVRLFQSPQGPPVFVLSLKAGGTGLNLTGANHV